MYYKCITYSKIIKQKTDFEENIFFYIFLHNNTLTKKSSENKLLYEIIVKLFGSIYNG